MRGWKTSMLRVRISESEKSYLEREAAALKIPVSEYVRRRLFEIAPRLNDMKGPNANEVGTP